MKKILSVLLISSVVLFSSCDKKLTEIEPEYFINTRGDIKSLEDCNKLLNGAYKAMINTSYYGSNMLMTDLMSEDAIKGNTTYIDAMELVDWSYTPISPLTNRTWLAAYNVVAHTNMVIESVNKVPNTNDRLKRNVLGQAYALRGLVFFDILRLYGEDYDRNSDKLGIIARTTVDITSLKRSTVKDSYTQILGDLTKAEEILKDVPVNAGNVNNNFLDEWGAKALLARVYLYAGMYKEAYDHASMVIANPKFKLESGSNFLQVWRDDMYGGEVIFGLRVNLVDNIRVGTFLTDYDGARVAKRNYFDPSVILTRDYDKNTDVRYAAYFNDSIGIARIGSSTPALIKRPLLTKYSGRNASWNNIQDIKVIRIAEMFLIRAEAAAYESSLGDGLALSDLEAVQSARISDHISQALTGEDLKEAIKLERRKEFPFEAQTWFDLRRGKTEIDRDPAIFKSNKASNLKLAADSYLRAWPIPFAEVTNTEGVSVLQNDQY